MKKIIFFALILLCMGFDVYADSHDVQAKYEIVYSDEVYKINLKNNEKRIKIDDYSIVFSSSDTIDVVIIKMENSEKTYAKSFTNIENNYFIMFYKNGTKVRKPNVNMEIESTNKAISIYDNKGNILKIATKAINLNSNNYIF